MLRLLACLFIFSACTTTPSPVAQKYTGKTVYSKVGIFAEGRGGGFVRYSTNHIGLPQSYSVNTPFKVISMDSRNIILKDPEGTIVRTRYVKKHNLVSADDYFKNLFIIHRLLF